MCHRLMYASLLLIPMRGSLMQEGNLCWLAGRQTRQQRLAKQAVQTIPVPLLIEGDHKEMGPLQLLKQMLACLLPGDRLTESRVHLREHGRLKQEALDGLRLALQDLLLYIVQQHAMMATKHLDKGGAIQPITQSQSRQLQPRDPALGALL